MVKATKAKTKPRNKSNKQKSQKPVRIVLKHQDTLGRHGYRNVKSLSETERHLALLGAIGEFGHTYVIKKLNVLAIYNKRKHPNMAALFRNDMRFVQRVRNAERSQLKPPRRRARSSP